MKIRSLIFENLGIKIASIIFAVILWFFVMSRGKTEMSFNANLEFRNIPKNLELVGEPPKSVDVWLRGQESSLRGLKIDDVKVSVDLSGAREGEGNYYIDPKNVKVPFNLKVVRISPPSIKIRLDNIITKTVEIRPTIVGKPAPGFVLSRIEVYPSFIKAEGARKMIDPLRFLSTEPVDITGAYKNFTQKGRINTAGKNIRVQEKDEIKIKVFIVKEGR